MNELSFQYPDCKLMLKLVLSLLPLLPNRFFRCANVRIGFMSLHRRPLRTHHG